MKGIGFIKSQNNKPILRLNCKIFIKIKFINYSIEILITFAKK